MPDATALEMNADIPARVGPALSATSDMPDVRPEPPPLSEEVNRVGRGTQEAASADAGVAAGAETGVAEGEEGDPVAAEEGGEGEAVTPPARKTRPTVQERFGELTAARKAAEAKSAEAEAKADALAKSLAEVTAAVKALTDRPSEAAPAEPKPKREAFDTPDAYDEALVAWSAKQATELTLRQAQAERLAKEQTDAKTATDAKVAEQTAALQRDWSAKTAKVAEEYPDFDAVTSDDKLPVTIPMSHAILNVDNGPQVYYHLGKNPEVAARIAALDTPLKQAIEIGKLSATLAAKAATVSKAPPPLRRVGTNNGANEKGLGEMSMEEYAKHRQATLNASRTHQPRIGARPN